MWPLAFIALGVIWYMNERKKPAPAPPAPPAAPPVDPNALIAQGMAFAMAQEQPEEGVSAPPADQGSGGSGGGGGYVDDSGQVSVTSPVNAPAPAAQPAAPAPIQALKMPTQIAQAKLETTSATQMASRLQAPMGSIAKRRTL